MDLTMDTASRPCDDEAGAPDAPFAEDDQASAVMLVTLIDRGTLVVEAIDLF